MTNLQRVMLDRLCIEFGIDVAIAEGLNGDDLDHWISKAEDDLFRCLQSDHKEDLSIN